VVLAYEEKSELVPDAARTLVLQEKRAKEGRANVGLIGAGNFATRVLVPAFKKAGVTLDSVSSSGGLSATIAGRHHGFARATSDLESILADASIDTVVIATRHDSHATLASRALKAGKHVFVEKPLALSLTELSTVASAVESATAVFCVGFNRRFAPHIQKVKKILDDRIGPVVISVTVNAGIVAPDHWTRDQRIGGGRIVGEGCHFIDLCRFLAASPIATLQVVSARHGEQRVIEDTALLQLSFADGSVATIQYFSTGNKSFPKERIELAFDGKVIRLDNYRTIKSWGPPGVSSRWPRSPDKGHDALAKAFVDAIRHGGSSPIPYGELFEVAFFAIEAERLARDGGGVLIGQDFSAQFPAR
jgi:predicted dehydrogenase